MPFIEYERFDKLFTKHEQTALHIHLLTMAQRLSWSSNTGGFFAAAAGACTAGLPGLGAVCGAAALKGLGPWRNVGFLWVFISSVTFFSPAKFKVKNVLLKKTLSFFPALFRHSSLNRNLACKVSSWILMVVLSFRD